MFHCFQWMMLYKTQDVITAKLVEFQLVMYLILEAINYYYYLCNFLMWRAEGMRRQSILNVRLDWPYNINHTLNCLVIVWHLDLTVWFESLTVWFDRGNRISRLLKITEGRCSAASKASLIKTFKILQNLPFWNGRW